MMSSRAARGLAVLVCLAGWTAAAAADSTEPKTGSIGATLRELQLPDLDGDTVDLGSYLGKPLLLDFWATWCKPCLAALPELNALHADYAERGLQMLGVNEDGQRSAAKVKPFVRTHGFEFPVVLDLNNEAQARLNVVVLPTTLLVDAEGRVVHTTFGYRKGEIEALRAQIDKLLPATHD